MRKNVRKAAAILLIAALCFGMVIPAYAKYASIWSGSVWLQPAVPALSIQMLGEQGGLLTDGCKEIHFAVSNREDDRISEIAMEYWVEFTVQGLESGFSIALFQEGIELPLELTADGYRCAAASLPAGMEQRQEYLLQISGIGEGSLTLTVIAEQLPLALYN